MKKVLLLGEFSALHKNLKEGLRTHGVDVTTASAGDSWKGIGADVGLGPSGPGYFATLERVLYAGLRLPKLTGYDVIQFVASRPFNPILNTMLVRYLVRHNGTSFLLAAGCDSTYYEGVKQLRYSPCKDCLQQDQPGGCPLMVPSFQKTHREVCEMVDGIIPVMVDYAAAYRSFPNIRRTIPLPVDVHDIEYRANKVDGKIRIFHGINREGFKGTSLIRTALDIVKQHYPNDVEIIIDGKMPLSKYLDLLKTVNVVVDQCHSYSYGMNALYSMAQGKVVLTGVEPECLDELGLSSAPAINIRPDINDIVDKIEMLLASRNKISELGQRSRIFVEEHHCAEKVAGLYLKTWAA